MTLLEDMAYCLMGLLGAYMSLLYGEGHNAFLRLQLQVIEKRNDPTLLALEAGLYKTGTHVESMKQELVDHWTGYVCRWASWV